MLRQAPLMSNRKLQTLPSDVGTPAKLIDLTGSNQDQSFLVCREGSLQGFQ